MEALSKSDKSYLTGYATALQDLMRTVTGDNTCAKSYDPIEIDDKSIHSYAFDLKDGGRHHPISDYESIQEVTDLMLKESTEFIVSNK